MNLNVKIRLFLSHGLLILFIISLGAYSFFALSSMDVIASEIGDIRLPNVQHSEEMNTEATYYRLKQYRHIIALNGQEMGAVESEMAEIEKSMEKRLSDYEKVIRSDAQRKLYDDVKTKWNNYLQVSKKVVALNRELKSEEANALMRGGAKKIFDEATGAINALINYNAAAADKSREEADAIYSRVSVISLIIVIVSVFAGFLTAFFISRGIAKPLSNLEGTALQMAGGDLTGSDVLVRSKDEIGRLTDSFNIMKNNLKDIIFQLTVIAKEVSLTAAGLAGQAQQTSAAASENAATVEEIATTVDRVAQNTQDISAASQEISANAFEGGKGVDRVQNQMNVISTSSDKATSIIDELSKTLVRVTQIVDLITQIADQTNLLALNAAIEAARAGEQGRGFAVVAEEVRKLAEQSAGAAKEINQLITQVQSESKVAVDTMNHGNREVVEGVKVVAEVNENLKGVLAGIGEFADKIQNVAAATEQVSAGVQNVASSTEEQTAAMEEVSAATETLTRMAEELNDMAGKFKV